ncbi:MAG: FAD-dependent monooxygenase, partial [Acidimicrobiales bacterium]
TREHLRRWGIADRLAAASPFGVDYPANVMFVTSLGGELIVRFEDAFNCSPAPDQRYSEHSQWIPQYKLEAVLRDFATSLESVRIEPGRELVDFEQDGQAVTAIARDVGTGATHPIDAHYLVGADGAASTVRHLIGAEMVGTYGLSRNYNTIFRAPGLADAHPHGPGIMYWQLNPDAPSLIGPMDEGDVWFFMPTGLPDGTSFTDEEIVHLIRRSTGIDLPYEILSSDEWVASRLLADRYADGRVFLVGDACHLHPPFGGFGMNMGVADGVDLGWKLAAVLQGWGGSTLLDSYELERRPAHEFVMQEAEANHALNPSGLFRPGMEAPTPDGEAIRAEVARVIAEHKRDEFYALGVVLGVCYRHSLVIAGDGRSADEKPSRDYTPSAAPGCLAPHRWLDDGSSLYDRFGSGFTLLLLGDDHEDDVTAAAAESERTGTPLEIVPVDDPAVAVLYETGLVLIRPDQHIAWRGNSWPATDLLCHVTGRQT